MATETTETVTPAPEAAAQDATKQPEQGKDGQPFDAPRAQELIDKLRDEIKGLKSKAKKADELEAAEAQRKESEMSDLEKAQKRLAELENKLKDNELREMRRKVGDEYRLPAEIAELLQGDDIEAMQAHAAKLVKALPKAQPPVIPPTNPSAAQATTTDAQKRAFLFNGGPLPK